MATQKVEEVIKNYYKRQYSTLLNIIEGFMTFFPNKKNISTITVKELVSWLYEKSQGR